MNFTGIQNVTASTKISEVRKFVSELISFTTKKKIYSDWAVIVEVKIQKKLWFTHVKYFDGILERNNDIIYGVSEISTIKLDNEVKWG